MSDHSKSRASSHAPARVPVDGIYMRWYAVVARIARCHCKVRRNLQSPAKSIAAAICYDPSLSDRGRVRRLSLTLRLLHSLPPEAAHRVTIAALRLGLAGAVSDPPDSILRS